MGKDCNCQLSEKKRTTDLHLSQLDVTENVGVWNTKTEKGCFIKKKNILYYLLFKQEAYDFHPIGIC